MTRHVQIDGRKILVEAGLCPTRQRVSLAKLLFTQCDRHVTAEQLHKEALGSNVAVSLATVYNTLHQFIQAGLLREIAIEGPKTYFCTNTSNHYHFFSETDGELVDIPLDAINIQVLPEPPEGMEIAHIDVLVRIVEKSGA